MVSSSICRSGRFDTLVSSRSTARVSEHSPDELPRNPGQVGRLADELGKAMSLKLCVSLSGCGLRSLGKNGKEICLIEWNDSVANA
jgi:hypothetical protein